MLSVYFRILLLAVLFFWFSNTGYGQDPRTQIIPSNVKYSFVVPNEDIKITKVKVKRVQGTPIIVGTGSDGKTYYSPDLFPNFQPRNIARVGLVNDELIMLNRDGKRFCLAYETRSEQYKVIPLKNKKQTNLPSQRVTILVPSLTRRSPNK